MAYSTRLVPLTVDSLAWTALYPLKVLANLRKVSTGGTMMHGHLRTRNKIRRGAHPHHTAQKLADSRLVVVRMALTRDTEWSDSGMRSAQGTWLLHRSPCRGCRGPNAIQKVNRKSGLHPSCILETQTVVIYKR